MRDHVVETEPCPACQSVKSADHVCGYCLDKPRPKAERGWPALGSVKTLPFVPPGVLEAAIAKREAMKARGEPCGDNAVSLEDLQANWRLRQEVLAGAGCLTMAAGHLETWFGPPGGPAVMWHDPAIPLKVSAIQTIGSLEEVDRALAAGELTESGAASLRAIFQAKGVDIKDLPPRKVCGHHCPSQHLICTEAPGHKGPHSDILPGRDGHRVEWREDTTCDVLHPHHDVMCHIPWKHEGEHKGRNEHVFCSWCGDSTVDEKPVAVEDDEKVCEWCGQFCHACDCGGRGR